MKCRTGSIALLIGSSCIASLACAETSAVSASPASGQMVSVVVSTVLVVALIAAAAWLLKRLAPHPYSRNGTLRIVAGAAVGQRERVVVVEIGASWLVLGVAPGSVNVLHHLPRAEPPATPAATVNSPRTFAQWLTKMSKNKNENK